MNKRVYFFIVSAGMALGLAGCGSHNETVSYLVSHPKKLRDSFTHCSKLVQSGGGVLTKQENDECAKVQAASYFYHDKKLYGMLKIKEPYPGKDAKFFQDNFDTNVPDGKIDSQPWYQEQEWCRAQLINRFYIFSKNTGFMGGLKYEDKQWKAISPACLAVHKIDTQALM